MPIKKSFFRAVLATFVLSSLPLLAHKETHLEKWFDQMNIISSHNSSEAISDSALGVNFLGGSGLVQGRVFDLNPIHIQLPRFSAGCGGISYAMGAINIASGEEVVNAIKSILSNAHTYAFELALHTATPLIASISGEIQSYANSFNNTNINSCEMGRSLVNSAWPASQHTSSYICEQGGNNTLFDGLIKRRHNCSKPLDDKSNPQRGLEKKLQKETDLLLGNYNVAWKVFNKIPNLSKEEKDFLLNLTGTLIRYEGECKLFPSKGEEAWKAILHGGVLEKAYSFVPKGEDLVYAELKEKDLLITAKQAWGPKLLAAMESLQRKIQRGRGEESQGSNYAFSLEEETLLQGTKMHLGTLLVLNSRKDGTSKMVSLSQYANLEAFQRLFTFFSQALTRIREVALSLAQAQVNAEDLKNFLLELENVRNQLVEERVKVQSELNAMHQFEKFLREKDAYQRALESLL